MARYSRIRDAARLQEGLTNYIQHLQTAGTRPRRIGQGGARNLNARVYAPLFNRNYSTDEVLEARANLEQYNQLAPFINAGGNEGTTSLDRGSADLLPGRGFSLARVVWFRNATRVTTVERSEVTNLQYLKYNGTRSSCPFGARTATSDQIPAFNEIRLEIVLNNPSLAVNRVSLVKEKFSLRA